MHNIAEHIETILEDASLLWLDRDGVINPLIPTPDLPGQAGYGPKNADEVSCVYPGAVTLIREAQYRKLPIIIGSNQGPLHAHWDYREVPINPYQHVTLREHQAIYQRFLACMDQYDIHVEALPEARRYSNWSVMSWADHLTIHTKIMRMLREQGIDVDQLCVLYCPHAAKANCSCRKPKIGLFQQAEILLSLSEAQKHTPVVVGDSIVDWQFAQELEARFYLTNTGNSLATRQHLSESSGGYDPALFLNCSGERKELER